MADRKGRVVSNRNQRKVGGHYEEVAASYLTKQGLRILERNYRCRLGEIDIVGKEGQTYVFCEVKFRTNGGTGDPAEAVDSRKQAAIFRVAAYYLKQHGIWEETPCRFDVIAIQGVGEQSRIRWIPDAFGGF